MVPKVSVILLAALLAVSAAAQVNQVATTGLPSPQLSGTGSPSGSYACNLTSANVTYIQTDSINGRLWVCDQAATPGAWAWDHLVVNAAAFYNSSGLITSSAFKCWLGTATTATGGTFTINYTNAGFTAAPIIQMQALAAGSAANQLYVANPLASTLTSTGVTGYVSSGTTLSILGATVVLAPASVTVHIMACGT